MIEQHEPNEKNDDPFLLSENWPFIVHSSYDEQ